MKIKYTGRHYYDREWLSKYSIGNVSFGRYKQLRDVFMDDYYCHQNSGLLNHQIVKKYIKHDLPLLYKWLEECKIPFGGYAEAEFGLAEMNLLLKPGSQEELAFRLCFHIKEEIE